MTALLLQPLTVQTSKDITKSSATVTIGVPQGESFSCTLFNVFQDTLRANNRETDIHCNVRCSLPNASEYLNCHRILTHACVLWSCQSSLPNACGYQPDHRALNYACE